MCHTYHYTFPTCTHTDPLSPFPCAGLQFFTPAQLADPRTISPAHWAYIHALPATVVTPADLELYLSPRHFSSSSSLSLGWPGYPCPVCVVGGAGATAAAAEVEGEGEGEGDGEGEVERKEEEEGGTGGEEGGQSQGQETTPTTAETAPNPAVPSSSDTTTQYATT
ncbi:hypothetical protein MMC19_007211, partial [Ptychographa xylographoides]|nr:hypothetical protein [Ptychographa xylographoides]